MRNLTSDGVDCTGLDAAVMLAIALVLDPEAALRPPARATAPAPPPPPPAPPDFPPPPPSCPVATPCPPVIPPAPVVAREPFTVTGRAVLAGGLLPTTAGGVAVDLPVYRALHVSAGALFLPEVRTSTGNFGFGITAPWLGACAAPWRGSRFAVSFCEDLLLGAIHAVDYALVPTTPGDRFWGGAATEVDLRARLIGPLALEIGGELLFPLTRQEFTVEGQTARCSRSGWRPESASSEWGRRFRDGAGPLPRLTSQNVPASEDTRLMLATAGAEEAALRLDAVKVHERHADSCA